MPSSTASCTQRTASPSTARPCANHQKNPPSVASLTPTTPSEPLKPSMGAAVRDHRNAVRDRSESLAAINRNTCPQSPESALIQYSLNKASFYSVFSQSFPPCRSRYTAIRPSMHSRCWRARQNGGTRRSRPRGRLRVPVGAAPPLQCVRRRAGEAPHQSGGSVIKLDITADGLLHHRLDDRSAEALPFRR